MPNAGERGAPDIIRTPADAGPAATDNRQPEDDRPDKHNALEKIDSMKASLLDVREQAWLLKTSS